MENHGSPFDIILQKLNVSGFRGKIGDQFNPQTVFILINCFLEWNQTEKIVIARDTRPTSPYYLDFIQFICLSKGIEVINCSVVPTPTCLFQVKEQGAGSGIMITASHNPVEYNAVKLVKKGGYFVNEEDVEDLKKFIRIKKDDESRAFSFRYPIKKPIYYSKAVDEHIEKIEKIFDFRAIQGKNIKIACDFCNGTAAFAIPKLLKRLNVEYSAIFTDPEKAFERIPEPNQETMRYLSAFMKNGDAKIGLIFDPDADRVAVLLENGKIISEEYMLALVYGYYVEKCGGNITVNLSTSSMVDQIATENGFKVFHAKVGEINVTEKMMANECVIGGEGNGGVIYFPVSNSRDTLVAATFILEMLAVRPEIMDEILGKFSKWKMVKEKYKTNSLNIGFVKDFFISNFNGRIKSFNEEDGIRINFNRGFVHIRKSNTEPVVRIIGEGEDVFIDSVFEKIKEKKLITDREK